MAINTKQQVQQKPKDIHLPSLSWWPKKQISDRDRKFFTSQLALLLETGTSMQLSLQALLRQLSNPAMMDLVRQLLEDIEGGKQFSVALARHPDVFSTTYVNLIAASEDGGFMHEVLEQLLEMEEKREKLRRTMSSALSYPAFLMVFALAVVVFVLVVVFPKFADLFSQIHDQLPATTVFLMATSETLESYWMYLVSAFAVVIFAFRYWAGTAQGVEKLDWARLNLPLIGEIFTQLYLVQSLRVLSLSLNNGVGIMDSLRACREVVSNRIFQRLIANVEDHVERGSGVASGFEDSPFIPPIVEQMIRTGESTGNLPKVLGRLSDHFEAELSNRLQTLSRLAEPVMLLVMGGVVGLIVSSLILPIFKLSRAVS